MKNLKNQNEIIIYTAPDGDIKVDSVFRNETIWLTQKNMAGLFDCSSDNISLHLKNIYKDGELSTDLTTEDFSVVQKEGNKEVKRLIRLYNLDAIISVGYRINSLRGTQFRIWATQKLKEEELELKRLNLLVEQFLSFAELQSVEERLMYMKDWIRKLDEFLIFNEKNVLAGSGTVSRGDMEEKVREELIKYNHQIS